MFTRKRWLSIAGCFLLLGLELSLWPFSRSKVSLVGFALGISALIGFCWGIALVVYLMAALFQAGRRKANPGVQPVLKLLSGLGDEARHRWLVRGCRWPDLRGFVSNVLRAGGEVFYALTLQAGFGSLLGLVIIALFKFMK
jgi:hypothetical protein